MVRLISLWVRISVAKPLVERAIIYLFENATRSGWRRSQTLDWTRWSSNCASRGEIFPEPAYWRGILIRRGRLILLEFPSMLSGLLIEVFSRRSSNGIPLSIDSHPDRTR